MFAKTQLPSARGSPQMSGLWPWINCEHMITQFNEGTGQRNIIFWHKSASTRTGATSMAGIAAIEEVHGMPEQGRKSRGERGRRP